MSTDKHKPIAGKQREKLIIALQMEEMVAAINTVMRVRKLSFELDYTRDHFPRLCVSMPGCTPEQFMLLDQRKHACYITPPKQRDLFLGIADMTERLYKLGGRLSLTGGKQKHGPMKVSLQIYVDGTSSIALSLMRTTKGNTVTDTSFQLPDGTTP